MTRSGRTVAASLTRLSLYNTGSKVSLYTNQIRKHFSDERNACVLSELMDCEKHICIVTPVVFFVVVEIAAVMVTRFTSFWVKNI